MNVIPSASPDFMDDRDIRVFERGGGTRFLQKPVAADRVVKQIVGQDLERHFAAEVDVDRAIDDAHPAAADFLDRS